MPAAKRRSGKWRDLLLVAILAGIAGVTEGLVYNEPPNPYIYWLAGGIGVAIIGYLVATGEFFDKEVSVGDKITIDDRDFKVVGTLERIGSEQDDQSLWIPLETSKEFFGVDDYLVIMVQTKDGFVPGDVAEDIIDDLGKARNVKEDEEDFTVQTMEQMMESVGVVLDVTQVVLVGIAFISLLVGGIGIMNTMYTSVLERTNEIGVMKAVGARNEDIMLLFTVESGVLGLVGGIVGTVIGIAISKVVEVVASSSLGSDLLLITLSPYLIFGALAFSFITGCISGILPAIQASKLNPVDALRYE